MPLATLYNALAYSITLSPIYATAAANFVYTYFVNPDTRMTPNLQYGQMLRGPPSDANNGVQNGQFMGIVDARGFISVWNSVAILKAGGTDAWTDDMDAGLMEWAGNYSNWLVVSDLGQKAAMTPNNHGSFWMAQMAAIKYYQGDFDGVRSTINYYLTHQFLDQIAASGEQPFEATRTRPFHYRAFNLEAMIAIAKLGDQVGMNVWAAQSRYRATIQDALDFAITQPTQGEAFTTILPHLASVAVAYGDPKGKYAALAMKQDKGYAGRTWWWHDVTGAFGPSSSVSHQKRWARSRSTSRSKRSMDRPLAGSESVGIVGNTAVLVAAAAPPSPASAATSAVWAPGEEPIRPDIFGSVEDNVSIQLDDGVYVTWDDVRPFYLTVMPSTTPLDGGPLPPDDSPDDSSSDDGQDES